MSIQCQISRTCKHKLKQVIHNPHNHMQNKRTLNTIQILHCNCISLCNRCAASRSNLIACRGQPMTQVNTLRKVIPSKQKGLRFSMTNGTN